MNPLLFFIKIFVNEINNISIFKILHNKKENKIRVYS